MSRHLMAAVGVLALGEAQSAPVQIVGIGGAPANVGALQVQVDGGEFGSVCGLNLGAANVACRQLGYEYGVPSLSPCGTYGAANLCGASGTKIAMQDLACTGDELTLAECAWSAPSGACLAHEADSIVYCGSSSTGTGEGSVRLLSADGAPSLTGQGALEIFVNEEWSPVCGISPGAQSLACKALGFAGADSSAGSMEVAGGRIPGVGKLDCKGSETSLLDCSFEAGDDVYCAPAEASTISCT